MFGSMSRTATSTISPGGGVATGGAACAGGGADVDRLRYTAAAARAASRLTKTIKIARRLFLSIMFLLSLVTSDESRVTSEPLITRHSSLAKGLYS